MKQYDIISNDKDTIARARKLEIEPLILGEEVQLVTDNAEQKNSLLVLATNTNRELIQSNIDGVVELESSEKNDFIHHRRAGVDQVIANILKEKNAAILISLQQLRDATQPETVLGRIQQNIRVAKKLGVKVILASFADKPEDLPSTHDQEAFWRAMGVDQKVVAESHNNLRSLIAQAKHRASDSYVAQGVEKHT